MGLYFSSVSVPALALAFRVFTPTASEDYYILFTATGPAGVGGQLLSRPRDPSASVGPLLLWLDVSLSERECVFTVSKIHAVSAVILAPLSLLLL
jgi:hypothetical protein